MASNEDWVVPASLDERRFAVFNVSNSRQGDRAYFDALHRELYETGGAEAFVHDMLAMPLGDWHPRFDVPQTEGLKDQQVASAAPEVHWLWSLLEDGELPGFVVGAGQAQKLLDHAKKSGVKYFTRPKMRALLEKIGAQRKERNTGNYYVFPPLLEARKNFEAAYPGYEPFTESETAVWRNIEGYTEV
jgi:hypothetical protein